MLMTASIISSTFSVLMERSNNADDSKITLHWLWNIYVERHSFIFLFFAAAVAEANLPFQLYKMPSTGLHIVGLQWMFPFSLYPFSNFWKRAARSCDHPNQKVEQSRRLRAAQRAAGSSGWKRGCQKEGHVKNEKSTIKSNVSFLIQLCHRL